MTGPFVRQDASEVDVGELALVVWRSKRLVLSCMIVIGGLFAIYAFTATTWYRAEVVLVQVEQGASQNPLERFSDLASLAGISTGGTSAMQVRVAVLKSRDLASEFIEKEGLEPQLIEAARGGFISRALASHKNARPDSRDALAFFDKQVRVVDDDKKAGVVRLAIIWKDPELAARWANAFALHADAKLREAANQEAETNVEYLKGELVKTNIPAMQQSLSRLLESEMGKVLLTRGGVDYAFKVIDRAIVPKEKYRPQRLLLLVVGSVGGLILGIAIAMVRYAARGAILR
jgi:uncharacterized protein involved in exopolysaccharide biosynthesis